MARMEEQFYIKSSGRGNQCIVSKDELIKTVEYQSAILARFLKQGYASHSPSSGLTSNKFSDLKVIHPETYELDKLEYRYRKGAEALKSFHVDLGKAIVKNTHFINGVKNNKTTKGWWFYAICGESAGSFIARTCIFEGTICPVCQTIIESKDIIGHREAAKCYDLVKPPQGYRPLNKSRISASIIGQAGNIPYVFTGKFVDVYIPAWIEDAVASWEKNQNYAGLTLPEYLRKLADSDSHQS